MSNGWPELPFDAWRNTKDTLHMELQIVGKLRLALSPFEPQWANVPLYLTARGLTTSPMSSSGRTFEVQIDLLDHQVLVLTTDGAQERVALKSQPVAAFYQQMVAALDRLGIDVTISLRPSEVDDPIPFNEDDTHTEYDPQWATRFFHVLSNIDLALKEHRAHFRGRTSPVQFFWGTFDLAHQRYSGRPAQPPPNAGSIYRLGGDAELICVGFWPGDARFPAPALFSYAYPKPPRLEQEPVRPGSARWDMAVREFLLPYDDIRRMDSPREGILEFAESVYAAASRLADWDPGLVVAQQKSPSLIG